MVAHLEFVVRPCVSVVFTCSLCGIFTWSFVVYLPAAVRFIDVNVGEDRMLRGPERVGAVRENNREST